MPVFKDTVVVPEPVFKAYTPTPEPEANELMAYSSIFPVTGKRLAAKGFISFTDTRPSLRILILSLLSVLNAKCILSVVPKKLFVELVPLFPSIFQSLLFKFTQMDPFQ